MQECGCDTLHNVHTACYQYRMLVAHARGTYIKTMFIHIEDILAAPIVYITATALLLLLLQPLLLL
jgi:hypothetical protein